MKIILALAGAIILLGVVVHRRRLTLHDAREPPVVHSWVPILGHVLGMLREGSAYYTRLTKKCGLPIYTLPLPGSKVYIVTSPSLVSTIDRHSKTVSFAPIIVEWAKRILQVSPQGLAKLSNDLLCENPNANLREKSLRVMHHALGPGPGLERSSRDAIASLNTNLVFDAANLDGRSVQLFAWVRKIVTLASTDALYGSELNPFHQKEVQDALWAIDADLAYLAVNVWPHIAAPKASRARSQFFSAMVHYYESGGYKHASDVVQQRYTLNREHDISIEDIAHFDFSVSYGLLINTVPAASWALYNVISTPSLLKEVRDEILAAVGQQTGKAVDRLPEINLALVLPKCSLLNSVLRETLRTQSTNAAARIVLKDTMVEEQYLLKKDALLFVPSADIHSSQAAWGPNADKFDPYGFVESHDKRRGSRVPASAYRAFGSGGSVCPGRHLATTEILSILVILLLRYEIQPASASWLLPKGVPHVTKTILTPAQDIAVRVRSRSTSENGPPTFHWKSTESSRI